MSITGTPRHEVPPTAGLPPAWRDLAPWRPADASLADALAGFIGVEAVQLECSGTAALIVALTTLHRLSGRRVVVVPAYTCPLVALAVVHCGLRLRLCDLAADSIDLDAAALERCCDTQTLAVIPTHLGGRVADIATARGIAERVGAFVIEDAAQALGARQAGESVGLAGDAGFFSLAVGKGLTTFEGGVLVTRDAVLRREFQRTHSGIVQRQRGWELRRSLELLGYHIAYRPRLLRLAYGRPLRRALRRGDAVAAVGDDFGPKIPLHPLGTWRQGVAARAFARWPAFQADCTARAARHVARLARIKGVRVLGDPPGAQGTWPFLWLQLRDEAARDAALTRLWTRGLGVSRLFIHALPDYAYLRGIVDEADVPNARKLAATTLTVSNSPWLDGGAFETVCALLHEPRAGTS